MIYITGMGGSLSSIDKWPHTLVQFKRGQCPIGCGKVKPCIAHSMGTAHFHSSQMFRTIILIFGLITVIDRDSFVPINEQRQQQQQPTRIKNQPHSGGLAHQFRPFFLVNGHGSSLWKTAIHFCRSSLILTWKFGAVHFGIQFHLIFSKIHYLGTNEYTSPAFISDGLRWSDACCCGFGEICAFFSFARTRVRPLSCVVCCCIHPSVTCIHDRQPHQANTRPPEKRNYIENKSFQITQYIIFWLKNLKNDCS